MVYQVTTGEVELCGGIKVTSKVRIPYGPPTILYIYAVWGRDGVEIKDQLNSLVGQLPFLSSTDPGNLKRLCFFF